MTPWQLSVCAEGAGLNSREEIQRLQYAVWHIAALPLFKKFPSFKKFTEGNKKPVKGLDQNAIISYVNAHNERIKSNGKSSENNG